MLGAPVSLDLDGAVAKQAQSDGCSRLEVRYSREILSFMQGATFLQFCSPSYLPNDGTKLAPQFALNTCSLECE